MGGFGLGLFKLLLLLPGFLFLLAGVALGVMIQSVPLGLGLGGLGVLYLLAASVACAALDTIFLAALYQYAAFERVPQGFDRDSMEVAFKKKGA